MKNELITIDYLRSFNTKRFASTFSHWMLMYKEIEVILPEPERECKLSNQELIFFGLMFSYFVTVMIFAYYLAA